MKPVDALNKFAHWFWAKSVVCVQMYVCCSTSQRPGNGRNSLEQNQKSIGSGEVHHKIAWGWVRLSGWGGVGVGVGVGGWLEWGWCGLGLRWVWVENVIAHEIWAQFVLPGHLTGSRVCLWLNTISSYVLAWQWEPQLFKINQEIFWNDNANGKVIFWKKGYWDMKFQC